MRDNANVSARVKIWLRFAYAGHPEHPGLDITRICRMDLANFARNRRLVSLSRILTGRAEIKDFPADEVQGGDWYKRAMRAHANCLENLPLYTAVVVAIAVTGVRSIALDWLAIVLLAARVCQTFVHIALTPTNLATP